MSKNDGAKAKTEAAKKAMLQGRAFKQKPGPEVECYTNGWHPCGAFPCGCNPKAGTHSCTWHRKVRIHTAPYREQSAIRALADEK